MALYHRDVYLPESARSLSFAVRPRYSRHARDAAQNDRYGVAVLPDTFRSADADLIEVEIINGSIVKTVYRMKYDAHRDIVIVIHPHDGFVRTVWFNHRDDKHRTLRRDVYAKA